MKKIIILIIAAFILVSCKEKDVYHYEIKGVVIDQITKTTLTDINIKLYGGYGEFLGAGASDLLAETTTDNNGTFKINKDIELKDYSYYMLGAYDDVNLDDTARTSYNYYFTYILNSNTFLKASTLDSFLETVEISLVPSGVINIGVSNNLDEKYDTVVIKTEYHTDTIFNYGDIQLNFPPNKEYKFEMYYVLGNESYLFKTEDILIPNNRSRKSMLNYLIEN